MVGFAATNTLVAATFDASSQRVWVTSSEHGTTKAVGYASTSMFVWSASGARGGGLNMSEPVTLSSFASHVDHVSNTVWYRAGAAANASSQPSATWTQPTTCADALTGAPSVCMFVVAPIPDVDGRGPGVVAAQLDTVWTAELQSRALGDSVAGEASEAVALAVVQNSNPYMLVAATDRTVASSANGQAAVQAVERAVNGVLVHKSLAVRA